MKLFIGRVEKIQPQMRCHDVLIAQLYFMSLFRRLLYEKK